MIKSLEISKTISCRLYALYIYSMLYTYSKIYDFETARIK